MRSSDHLHRNIKWTVPNVLTAARIIMAAMAGVLFLVQEGEAVGVILCIVAALLDAFDGWYARTFSQCSNLGKHLDPFADKLLMAVVYTVIAVKMGSALVWVLVASIAVREVALTLFRAYSLRRHETFIPANRWGKVKMILQSTFGVVLITYAFMWNGGFHFSTTVVAVPLCVILLISYYSAIIYIKSWRETITNRSLEAGRGLERGGDKDESRRVAFGG